MPRALRSDSLHRRTLPWEMLTYVYSYCDVQTLAVLSLVSFGSWELASPILYEHVQIVDLDGLASLFFLESPPPSARLRDAVCPLSRIRSLSVEIKHWCQKIGPFFDTDSGPGHPAEFYDEDNLWASVDPIVVIRPHRLYRHTRDASLPIRELTLPHGGGWADTIRRQELLAAQVYSLLSPRSVVLVRAGGRDWASYRSAFKSLAFLRDAWDSVERMVFDGATFWHHDLHAEDYRELPLAILWAREREGRARTLELVLELSTRGLLRYKDHFPGDTEWARPWVRRTTLQMVLAEAGVTKEMLELVDLKVTVRVQAVDEAIARKDVDALEEWMKKLVVVEAV